MDRILHIVQESFENPRHRFLGSVKDTLGRHEYFACRKLPVDCVVAEGRSDDKVVEKLATLDLRQYRAAVFELPLYPRALQFLRRKAPHVRRLTRPINAELYHQYHLFKAHRRYPFAHDQRAQLLQDAKTAWERFRLDRVCARRSHAVLSISDWESANYWRWVAGPSRTQTVPYFTPTSLIQRVEPVEKRQLCVCPLSTAKSVRPFPLDSIQHFVHLATAYRRNGGGSWRFAMTGSTKVNTPWNSKITASLIVGHEVEQLGFVEDPIALLAEARAMAVLSDLGFGVKTKVLDAIAARCWVLMPPGLYGRLPAELQPYCIVVERLDDVDSFRRALDKAMMPFPEGDPNVALRQRAFATLDRVLEAR